SLTDVTSGYIGNTVSRRLKPTLTRMKAVCLEPFVCELQENSPTSLVGLAEAPNEQGIPVL
ncbi:hypothetical protein, partial [Methylobacterium oxalidis]|uniref:hypothetical protein n=1 Tax=Methylobacterium oxalidis TaxID=944322 RepID=UPI001EDD31A1